MEDTIKCPGCSKEMPKAKINNEGFRQGNGDRIVAWVCDDCYHKGVRWPKVK